MKDTGTKFYFKDGKMIDVHGNAVTLEIGNLEQIKALRNYEEEKINGKPCDIQSSVNIEIISNCHCGGRIGGEASTDVEMDSGGYIDDNCFSVDIVGTLCKCYQCGQKYRAKMIDHRIRLFETKK